MLWQERQFQTGLRVVGPGGFRDFKRKTYIYAFGGYEFRKNDTVNFIGILESLSLNSQEIFAFHSFNSILDI